MSTLASSRHGVRAGRELGYALIGFPVGLAGFIFVVVGLSVSAGLAVTFIGLPLLVVVLIGSRGFGAAYRSLARVLLDIDVPAPAARSSRRGLPRYLVDGPGWRAALFNLIRFPLAIVDFSVAVSFYAYGLGAATYWFWRPFLPAQHVNGVAHRGANFGSHYFVDTVPRIAVTAVVGLIVLLIAPWAVRASVSLDRRLIQGLLGPSQSALRVQQLEETRGQAVEDSAASLRRIERDLHDGAQARLVALAMSLGLAKDELNADDPAALARARTLVDAAHREAKGTIVDLRDLARGIHPPALDNGLDDALSTLCARSPIPVTLHVALPERPTPAVESIVYFCTAELLTNVTKHSGARHASVTVLRGTHRLLLRVEDDGAGGAAVGAHNGTGLAGLRDRLGTVDGSLAVISPSGGPSTMTIEVPL